MRLLGLFARLPRLGGVKSRLSPAFQPEEALSLHRALLSDSIDLLRRGARDAEASCRLYLSEAGSLDGDLAGGLAPCHPALQRGADLGERLREAFAEGLGSGFRHMVIIGSDSPHLPASWIVRAFAELERHELVIGPARDGGYYLLGAGRVQDFLFDQIPWGTSQVYRETVRRARHRGVSIGSLPALDDVDVPESVPRLLEELLRRQAAGEAELPRETLRLLREWESRGRISGQARRGGGGT